MPTEVITQVTETDVAQAIGKLKLKAVSAPTETDTAQTLTPAEFIVVPAAATATGAGNDPELNPLLLAADMPAWGEAKGARMTVSVGKRVTASAAAAGFARTQKTSPTLPHMFT